MKKKAISFEDMRKIYNACRECLEKKEIVRLNECKINCHIWKSLPKVEK